MTTQDKLDQINNAISAIENGAQEYRIGSRQIRKADLSVLYNERRNLERQLDQEQNLAVPGVFVARFDRR